MGQVRFMTGGLLIITLIVLSGCATWTGTVDRTATAEELETVPLTQKLDSSGFKLKAPDGWEALELSQAQQAQDMVGLYKHREKGATLGVYRPKGVLTVKAIREEADRFAEIMLPGAEQSDGPFSLGKTAMSPMYIRYSGVAYQEGDLVDRYAYCGYNLARTFLHHVIIMEVGTNDAEWSKREFISIMKGF
jgi:hypothetical protein